MMREILFRGKNKSDNKWFLGSLDNGANRISGSPEIRSHNCEDSWLSKRVIPESVQQYTGQEDHVGVKIFEGDWVEVNDTKTLCVQYIETGFMLCEGTTGGWLDFCDLWTALDSPSTVVVVGNEFDGRP